MTSRDEHLENAKLQFALFDKIQRLCSSTRNAVKEDLSAHREKCSENENPLGVISTTQFTLSRPSTPMVDALEYYPEIVRTINFHTMMHPEGWTWISTTEGADAHPENFEQNDWELVTRDPSSEYFMDNWWDVVLEHLKNHLNELHTNDFLKNARPDRPFGAIGDVKAEVLDGTYCRIDLDMIVDPSPNHFGQPGEPQVSMPLNPDDPEVTGPQV
jgi:hypothetical protein